MDHRWRTTAEAASWKQLPSSAQWRYPGPVPWQLSQKQHPGPSFLDLAQEIRDMVYEHYYNSTIILASKGVPHPRLILVSKQIHFEANSNLYEHSPIRLFLEDSCEQFFVERRLASHWGSHGLMFPESWEMPNIPPVNFYAHIRRIIIPHAHNHDTGGWYQPDLIARSERLVSRFRSLTHVEVEIDRTSFPYWHDLDNITLSWSTLWDEKNKAQNHELRLKLWDTTLDDLFPERLPIPSFLSVTLNYEDYRCYGYDIRDLRKEFSEAFTRRKREIEIEIAKGGDHTECDDGWVLSRGYAKSDEGDYLELRNVWVTDMIEGTWDRGDGDSSSDKFDDWAWGLEEIWDAGKYKQARRAIVSPALLRNHGWK